MFFKAVWLVAHAEYVPLCLLSHLLKSLQEETQFSEKESYCASVVGAHRAPRTGEQYVGPRDKGDPCILFNDGVSLSQDPQSLQGMCHGPEAVPGIAWAWTRGFLCHGEQCRTPNSDSYMGSSQDHDKWGGTVTSVVRLEV